MFNCLCPAFGFKRSLSFVSNTARPYFGRRTQHESRHVLTVSPFFGRQNGCNAATGAEVVS
jgi:hypothetical protein